MGALFVGTVTANDQNGRVVYIPDGARIIRVTQTPGKGGGGVRIDYMLPIGEPELPQPDDADGLATEDEDAAPDA